MSNTTTLQIICSSCQSTHHIKVNITNYAQWIEGELIQKALPNLTPEERELLISKTCGPCFNALFEEDNEHIVGEASCLCNKCINDDIPRCDTCHTHLHSDEIIVRYVQHKGSMFFCKKCDIGEEEVTA